MGFKEDNLSILINGLDDTRDDIDRVLDYPQEMYSIYDVESGDDILSLTFNSRNSIQLYKAFEEKYAKKLISGAEVLSKPIKLYEDLGCLELSTRDREDGAKLVILQLDVDLAYCLDLLSIGHIKLLYDFYYNELDREIINKKSEKARLDTAVIRAFYEYNIKNNRTNFKLVRRLRTHGKPIYAKSELREIMFIEYDILDTRCIKRINEYIK